VSCATPALGALPTAPSLARAYARTILGTWNLSHFEDLADLIVSEMVTNSVRASQDSKGRPLYGSDGQMLVIRACLLTDGSRLRAEVHDQAPGLPALRHVPDDAENGRGLALIDAITEGRWGWHPAPYGQSGKCTWAELYPPTP
jgi:hypothetical protein